MGVIYKLKEDVVRFIINERQHNPLFSCRQLAESVTHQFGLRLSKSSVHDVLKESGVVTPRGRKPKNTFKIPVEKKKEIQASLSHIALVNPVQNTVDSHIEPFALLEDKPHLKLPLSLPSDPVLDSVIAIPSSDSVIAIPSSDSVIAIPSSDSVIASEAKQSLNKIATPPSAPRNDTELNFTQGEVYEGAGKVFLKAALWDLGIFSEENIKDEDWEYYLTYASTINVFLENNKSYTLDWRMPLQRSIREAIDCFINNIKPLIVGTASEDDLFKSSMEAKTGFKIKNISIVDEKTHALSEFSNIVDLERHFILQNRHFVESYKKGLKERLKELFFPQVVDNKYDVEEIFNFKGFDTKNKEEFCVSLIIPESYDKNILQSAIDNLNNMFIRDEQGRLLQVKVTV